MKNRGKLLVFIAAGAALVASLINDKNNKTKSDEKNHIEIIDKNEK